MICKDEPYVKTKYLHKNQHMIDKMNDLK